MNSHEMSDSSKLGSIEKTEDEKGVYENIKEWIDDRNKKIEDECHAEKETEEEINEKELKEFKEKYESGFLDVTRKILEKKFETAKGDYKNRYSQDDCERMDIINRYRNIKNALSTVDNLVEKRDKIEKCRIEEVNLSSNGDKIEVSYEIKSKLTNKYKKGPTITMSMDSEPYDHNYDHDYDHNKNKYETIVINVNGVEIEGFKTGRKDIDIWKTKETIDKKNESPEEAIKRATQLAYGNGTELDIEKTPEGYTIKPKEESEE